MAMHLIDRPELTHGDIGHRGLSGLASAALHAVVAGTLIAALRVSTDDELPKAVTALLPDRVVWIPHTDEGGGSDRGGDRSVAPPRRVRAVGQNEISTPAPAPDVSTTSAIEPPEEISTLPVKPMGDATQTLVGVINSDGPTAGPGNAGTGNSPGAGPGAVGNKPGSGFGEGTTPNGPGVKMPTLIERVAPKYTADAMRARIQGSVWIECVVQTDGTVGELRVTQSLDRQFGLDEEAVKAARRWRFRPGSLHGEPVPVVVTIELMFSVR